MYQNVIGIYPLHYSFCLINFHFTDSCEFGSNHYFMLCGLGGILSCGLTHTMVTPLDLVKCRLQVDSAKYKSVVNGFRVSKTFINNQILQMHKFS